MEVNTSLKQLVWLTEQLEATENEITELAPQNPDLLSEGGIEVDLTVEIPFLDTLSQNSEIDLASTGATLTDEGSVSVELTARIADSATSDAVPNGRDVSESESTVNEVTDGGAIVTDLDPEMAESTERPSSLPSGESVEREDATESSMGASADETDDRDGPVYKDPERLAEAYDPDSTFAEMTDALEVDVTPQTVRNYMIEYGIHDPNTNGSPESDGGDESPFPTEAEFENLEADETAVAIVESVELPEDLTLSEVTEAVCTAKTLFEVERELGIERDQTRRLLSELNLLELVHGRLTTTSARSTSKEEVEQRIHEAVTSTNKAT